MKKLCTRCKIEKELDQFYPDPRYKLGVQSFCRVCKNNLAAAIMRAKRKRPDAARRRLAYRSSRQPEHHQNRLEWRRLQRSLARIVIESHDEELERLIEEQKRDARTFQIKHSFAYDTNHPYKLIPDGSMVVWDEYFNVERN